MIYEITKKLRAELVRRGVHLPVDYKDAAEKPRELSKPGIDIIRVPNADTLRRGGPRNNFGLAFVRDQAVRIEIRTRATMANARVEDHHRAAEILGDVVIAALDHVVRAPLEGGGSNDWKISRVGLMSTADLGIDGQTEPNGAGFAIDFTVDRGIKQSAAYAGQAATAGSVNGQATPTGLNSTTNVKLTGAAGDGDTACGG